MSFVGVTGTRRETHAAQNKIPVPGRLDCHAARRLLVMEDSQGAKGK